MLKRVAEDTPRPIREIIPETPHAPLRGMKLRSPFMDATRVADISPLKGMPLKDLNFRGFDVRPERDGPILRSLEQLETINSEPADVFLKALEAR